MAESDIVTTPEAESNTALAVAGSKGIHEFIRYFAASAVALILDAGVLWVLTSAFDIPYLYSGAIAFTLGLTLIYFLSIYWVFDQRAVRNWKAEFMLFALIGLIGLGLNELILWLFTDLFGFFFMISKFASVIVVFSWNFGARKWLLFRA